MPSITPSLWFDHNMEEAADFYTSVFPNSWVEDYNRSTDAGPGEPRSVLSGTSLRRFVATPSSSGRSTGT
jgi:predicted 3-demethylubiquinone-9 3-methyltransferase (glyoxalase superfamily)